jgi:hemerythrin-like domain-containing protein
MSHLIAAWHADHTNFANLLGLLEAQLQVLDQGESPDYELMLDIMYYMTHYPDRMHHAMEDAVFNKMIERGIGARSKLDALIGQHTALRERGNALVHDLDDVVNGSIASRSDIAASTRRYVADFRQHMESEEREVIPLAARSLNAEDWTAIRKAVMRMDDTLFGKTQLRRYATIRKHIAAQARQGNQPTP